MGDERIERHCETCTCGRRAPMQGEHAPPRRAAGTISWAEHLECYAVYAAEYGSGQSADRLAERGGFGWNEFVHFTGHEPTTWVPR